MFKHRISEKVGLKTYLDWLLLAFLAGSVNAGGWLACHRFVSHVTGFATLAGVDAVHGKWHDAISMMTVPVYFLFGVMVSAYLVDRRIHEGKQPRYSFVMGGVASLLAIAAIGGELSWFGEFGRPMRVDQDYFLLALLCAASGLQNAALTTASGATIRTTHLTGITTDLGIGLIRAASLAPRDPSRAVAMQANYLRMGTIVSFMLGSGVGASLFLQQGYRGFVLPSMIAVYAAFVARLDHRSSTQSNQ